MQLLKQFLDSYDHNYPKRLKENGSQTDSDIQQNKLKLKRVFCNSNVSFI
jgi:hypothetical protein